MTSQGTSNSATIKILILSDAPVDAITSPLQSVNLDFDGQQVTSEAEYRSCLDSAVDLILYNASHSPMTLEVAIAILGSRQPQIPLLVINGLPSISAAVTAIKTGAVDYLTVEALSELPDKIIQTLNNPKLLYSQAQCALDTEQQLQKLIVENADGILVVDDRGIVQFVNPAALKLLGKTSAELIGESLGFPVVNGDFLEVDLPVSRNCNLVAQMRVSQIKWQYNDAFIVSLRDITQLKQAETERAKLLKEAQAANRAKDEFLAVLSHELRTPLNPIVGWSQMLVRGNLSSEQINQAAEIIQRNAKLQTKLIEDILEISRIIRGKLKLQAIPVDLVQIVNNALDTVNLAAQAKSIEIVTKLDRDVGLVNGDSTRLQQIVWNLITNAVKFTPNGGRVEIRLISVDTPIQQQNNPESKLSFPYAQIQVIDSGKGITPEFLPYIFDYFRQAESTKSRSEGGLGLGLAIVRRLVELHGGEVQAMSEGLDRGTTFTVSLPIMNHATPKAEPRSPEASKSLEGAKILVVDDDPSSKDLVVIILEQEGATAKASNSATEALSVIEQFQPDLVISDIGMPGVDGYQLIQTIRALASQNQIEPNIKAIAISGYASEQDRQHSLNAGYDRHLNKPLSLDHLIEVVTQLISNKQMTND